MENAPLDHRRHPYRDDLAAAYLKDQVRAARFADPVPARVCSEVLSIQARPESGAMQISELLFGENVAIYEQRDDWAWVQGALDGYVGYVRAGGLSLDTLPPPTHLVSARLSHLFSQPTIKDPPVGRVTLGARLNVASISGKFARLDDGRHLIASHIRTINAPETDLVDVALRNLGAPYLWGGRSSLGLDCSGLVQVAVQAIGGEPPRDSDMQRDELGQNAPKPADMRDLRRGDIVYFPGHCMIADGAGKLVHANATHMAVTHEPVETVFARTRGGYGSVTHVRRWPA
ncbi:MAG: NlpC/P60 family protein [Minwuia sp.]|nr:NlpC/P60 family protein [Minwuia sp.]